MGSVQNPLFKIKSKWEHTVHFQLSSLASVATMAVPGVGPNWHSPSLLQPYIYIYSVFLFLEKEEEETNNIFKKWLIELRE